MERFGASGVEFLGLINRDEIPKKLDLFSRLFDEEMDDRDIKGLMSLTLLSRSKPGSWIVRGFGNDIRVDASRVGPDFHNTLHWDRHSSLISKYTRTPDFNAEYHLIPPPPRNLHDLLGRSYYMDQMDTTMLNPEDFGPFLRRAEPADKIQLIPKVPESICRTFQMAKDLYIFAAFQPYFATIGRHYAGLAVEAAVKTRWALTLKTPVKITGSKVSRTLITPTHDVICNMVRACGKRTTVNDKPFNPATSWVVDELVRQGILSKWFRRLINNSLFFRNTLSHREFPTIIPTGIEELERTALELNILFHSL